MPKTRALAKGGPTWEASTYRKWSQIDCNFSSPENACAVPLYPYCSVFWNIPEPGLQAAGSVCFEEAFLITCSLSSQISLTVTGYVFFMIKSLCIGKFNHSLHPPGNRSLRGSLAVPIHYSMFSHGNCMTVVATLAHGCHANQELMNERLAPFTVCAWQTFKP